MSGFDANELLQRTERRYETVTIDGIDITIQSLTVAEVQRYFQSNNDGVLFAASIVDPSTHQLVYGDEHIDQLNELDAKLALELRAEIGDFVGFAPRNNANTVEDAEKN